MKKALKVGREILIQIIPVAIGVYLGLIVNDWNTGRQTRERKAQSEVLLIQEIKVNMAKIEDGLSYHLMLLDSLEGLVQKESVGFKDLGFWKGTRTPTLYNAAYQSATLSGSINTFSIPEIQSIVEVYSAQQKFTDTNKIALQGLIQQDFYNESKLKQTINFINMMLNDISYAEKDLLDSYKKALRILED